MRWGILFVALLVGPGRLAQSPGGDAATSSYAASNHILRHNKTPMSNEQRKALTRAKEPHAMVGACRPTRL
jgi:hypothetical protein